MNKRLALKSALLTLDKYDCRRPVYQALASAHKWLLVTCFGYLGYKNARFGRIEAHEAVTAYGREALLRAKEAAEDLGFEILHMYVDGLWVQKPGCKTPADFEALLDEITERTGLPISMDGVYRWVVFLPSRVNEHVPVANRYFGVFQDGSIKVRGIEARRRDSAPFIAETQLRLLEILARAPDADHLKDVLPQAQAYRPQAVRGAAQGKRAARKAAGLAEAQPGTERVLVPLAGGACRLADAGRRQARPARPACALSLHTWANRACAPGMSLTSRIARSIDVPRYRILLERAVQTVLDPIEQSVNGRLERDRLVLFPVSGKAVGVFAPVPAVSIAQAGGYKKKAEILASTASTS